MLWVQYYRNLWSIEIEVCFNWYLYYPATSSSHQMSNKSLYWPQADNLKVYENRKTYLLLPPRHICAWLRTPLGPTPPHPPSCSSKRGRKIAHTFPPATTWSHSALAHSPAVSSDWGSVWCCWWHSSPPIKDSLTDTPTLTTSKFGVSTSRFLLPNKKISSNVSVCVVLEEDDVRNQ